MARQGEVVPFSTRNLKLADDIHTSYIVSPYLARQILPPPMDTFHRPRVTDGQTLDGNRTRVLVWYNSPRYSYGKEESVALPLFIGV